VAFRGQDTLQRRGQARVVFDYEDPRGDHWTDI
jgi:hypothetical protein